MIKRGKINSHPGNVKEFRSGIAEFLGCKITILEILMTG